MLDNCQEQIFIAVLGTLLRRFLVENSQQSWRKGAFEIPTLQTRKVKDSLIAGTPESQSRGTVVLCPSTLLTLSLSHCLDGFATSVVVQC